MKMVNFLCHQKCKKNHCNFYCFFKILLNKYDNTRKYLVNEVQKRQYSFLCPFCKMVAFLDFDAEASEKYNYLKRRL